jgi:hypothetical protein
MHRIETRTRRIVRGAALLVALGSFALGTSSGLSAATEERARAHQTVPRITVAKEPRIDGRLDEEAWESATLFTELTQVQPIEGIPAPVETRIRLMRSDRALFMAFECMEPDPDAMIIQDMKRDGGMAEDESVQIALDTFGDGSSAVWFVLSAAGGRLDGLLTDNGKRANISWDGTWEGRTGIEEDRWIAEISIPFRGLSFGATDCWRANFERYHGARRAHYRWQGAKRQFRVVTISEFGELSGFDGIPRSLGLEARPFAKLLRRSDHRDDSEDSVTDAGGEFTWRVTPQLNASVSVNTDFAETEVDARQVNLTRFGITFPEKRDFFLQDSQLFEFGWESGFTGGANLVPFRSRRIGLAPDGSEIPLDVSARVAGRVGPLGMGLLATRTGSSEDGSVPEGTLAVMRPAWRFSEELAVGSIHTLGDPANRDQAQTHGVDLAYSTSQVLPGLLSVNAFALRSENDSSPDPENRLDRGSALDQKGWGWGARGILTTSNWNFNLSTLGSQSGFRPALGYVSRAGMRLWSGGITWSPRPAGEDSAIRNYNFGVSPSMWTRSDGTLISSSISTTLFGLSWHDGDSFSISHGYSTDRPRAPFEPIGGVEIPADTHAWHTLSTSLGFSRTRPFSGSIGVGAGGWYDGDKITCSGALRWTPSASIGIDLAVSRNDVDLPDGRFSTQLERVSAGFSFSPDLRYETIVQHDDVSEALGFQGRLRWMQSDGRELFLVANLNWQEQIDGSLVPTDQDFAIKIEYAMRF